MFLTACPVYEDPSPDENIRLGLSYLARPAAVRVPPGTVDADVMPPAIAALARQAFGPGIKDPAQRPSAAKWHETLRTEWSATQTCQHRPHHTYGAHLTGCPWCARVTIGKSDPFNPPESAKQKTSKLDKRVLVVMLLLAALFLLIGITAALAGS